MRTSFTSLRLLSPIAALLLPGFAAPAATFTSDTLISFNNTNYDGQEIVVTNCTLTVDGIHSFASLQVLNGGNLTHTFWPDGYLHNWVTVTNEPQVLSVTNVVLLAHTNVHVSTIVVRDFAGLATYTTGVDYVIGLDENGLTTLLLTTNSAVVEGSTNLVSYDFLDTPGPAGLDLAVTADFLVAAGATINVDGKGYKGGMGPGAGRCAGSPPSGSGAGHGGYGAQSAALGDSGSTYDTIEQPTDLGSGGGCGYTGLGGAGGGKVRLVVGGTLRVDGSVSANGANGVNNRSGGGSGGSIWLSAQSFAGTGSLSANGGAGEPAQGGGGGGGRISVQYASTGFFGTTEAYGGNGYARGGAGTIYTRAYSQAVGQVLVHNAGVAGTNTPLATAEAADLTIQGEAVVSLPSSQTVGNLFVDSNARISWSTPGPSLMVTGDATIQTGGAITADGAGFACNTGPGAGKYYTSYGFAGGGGGHGGFGAAGGNPMAYGGSPYGSLISPGTPGSGGACYPQLRSGSAGGGAIRLSVSGILLLNGRISADGQGGLVDGSGGGSGGSIWLTAGTLAGSGTISANGGMGNGIGFVGGGGGGGGRIAIEHGMALFFGVVTARGGSGSAAGGAGTIYTRATSQSWGTVLVDNGGQVGTNTTLGSSSSGIVDLTVQGGAVLIPFVPQTIRNLLVASGGWLRLTNYDYVMTVTGNATVQAGGGILADGAGHPGNAGPGAGRYYSSSGTYYIGGGGGYGGYGAAGGAPAPYTAAGGSPYGLPMSVVERGSGGGGFSPYAVGGSGGGVIRLNVNGVLQVDGTISAAGYPGNAPSAGGGSGGSVSLNVGTLSGTGIISANGGAGNYLGGGGSGGRIAIQYTASTFSGLLSAYGGGGYAWGGAGTIYTKAAGRPTGLVTLDNGGHSGANTSWGISSGTIDLTVLGGAIFAPANSYPPTIGTLLVASNGWLLLAGSSGSSAPALTIAGNATVQAGGGIIADGTGFPGGQGNGAGKYAAQQVGYASSGGGHGGFGASSGGVKSAPGGIIYDLLSAPLGMGSGGGTYPPYLVGGAGGANIRLDVMGSLQVDGRISAGGMPGASADAGGGSGGSILLTVGALSGTGIIAADGGAGIGLGGGGGGGRIAITYTSTTFSGTMSARGGGGYAWGGAGTIYTKANNQSWGQLIVDNGGQAGTNTSWQPGGTLDLTVRNGAVVSPPQGPQSFRNLVVASNAWVSLSKHTLFVAGDATILAGGGIVADGAGYPANQGPGAGGYRHSEYGYVGSGAGHAGYGAPGGTSPAPAGGTNYGSVTAPEDSGSGGGAYPPLPFNVPGSSAGGGAIRLSVAGMLLVNGRISADGNASAGQGGGGGSGGSVWLTTGTLAGNGVISASGGAGTEVGGGGGGGRIALYFGANTFSGTTTARGGGGYAWGGAGTIYAKPENQSSGHVLIDNGGHYGTNTPVAFLPPFDLTIKGGAVAQPAGSSLVLSNLLLSDGGALTCFQSGTNLDVAVLRNATIDAGSAITVVGMGYGAGIGPGAGQSTNSIGSGAGYGGNGGASSARPGGETYGSAQQPVDWGSGGGLGYGAPAGGSEGGGTIRLTVGGILMVNGALNASGNPGLQDDSGGGSGGSIWLTAGALAGAGTIKADGGDGEVFEGGGGGGGRIAVYTPLNVFGGLLSVAGGDGFSPGQAGSIFYAVTPPAPQVTSISLAGTLTSAVSSVEVVFDAPMDPYSVRPPGVGLIAPGSGVVDGLTSTALSPYRYRVDFPTQTAQGDYQLTFGPQITDLNGQPLAQVYVGIFSIAWATVQGSITNSNGEPVPGVVVQSDGGGAAATTDTDGNYVLAVPPGGSVIVAPSRSGLVFVPSTRAYSDVTSAITNENYLAVTSVTPNLASQVQSNNFLLGWQGIAGVSYQTYFSTDLAVWLPYDNPQLGTNGPLQMVVPMDADPIKFFRVQALY
ncbi:MAG TPA: hypothetical protein P5205_01285 [Candidatus Paceibacterota bacterium]|nr:hypothetical protein [Verrucomicrobiota bacterium]HSA08982.1 hypothetical protein [Candidatus Paceibacterota bacterium]